jgi:hypothetical protein
VFPENQSLQRMQGAPFVRRLYRPLHNLSLAPIEESRQIKSFFLVLPHRTFPSQQRQRIHIDHQRCSTPLLPSREILRLPQ